MKFISITGPESDLDRMVEEHLSKYEIHLENALTELSDMTSLRPYTDDNPFKAKIKLVEGLIDSLSEEDKKISPDRSIEAKDASQTVKDMDSKLKPKKERLSEIDAKLSDLKVRRDNMSHFEGLDFEIDRILQFKYVRFRFGKILKDYYEKFKVYVYDNTPNAIFLECTTDDEYVWGIYFCQERDIAEIDAMFSFLHFERFYMPEDYYGKPSEANAKLSEKIEQLEEEKSKIQADISALLHDNAKYIITAYEYLLNYSNMYDTRKMAARVGNSNTTFYVMCGWMTAKDKEKFAKEIEDDPNVYFLSEDDDTASINIKPPTKLKNPKIFKPFESLLKVYGVPEYNELDPTVFVSITYAFMFGIMFGDVGHGLLLTIIGFLVYRSKKSQLAAMLGIAGLFSTFFGFMFGSIFGFEDVIPTLWLKPLDAMTNLPFFGRLNTVFVLAVAFGIILIFITMIFHIINGIKSKQLGEILFDHNAVTGLVFYGTAITLLVMAMTGHPITAGKIAAIIMIVCLIVMFLKEPLTSWLTKQKFKSDGGPAMFIVEGILDLFEIILSFFSNTLSFVRVGAFAVSHAAMMEVVLMLAGVEKGQANIIVLIIGNLFVCGLEGLIVAIQVLRLEFYELFSRFYKGDGKEFKPFYNNNNI